MITMLYPALRRHNMRTSGSPGVVTCLKIANLFKFEFKVKRFKSIFYFFPSPPNVPDIWEPKPPKGFESPKGEKKSITEPLFFFDLTGKFRLACEYEKNIRSIFTREQNVLFLIILYKNLRREFSIPRLDSILLHCERSSHLIRFWSNFILHICLLHSCICILDSRRNLCLNLICFDKYFIFTSMYR